MKKAVFLMLIGACCSYGMQAQNIPAATSQEFGNVRFALSAAPVLSWFSPDGERGTVETDGPRFSIKYGLHMDFKIGGNDNYWFSSGLFMVNTGGSLSHDWAINREGSSDLLRTRREVDYRLNYITVPLNFKLMTNEVGYSRYFARVGFDFGVAVNSRFDTRDVAVEIAGTSTFERENASAEDFTRFYRTALHIEAGMEYNIGGNTNLMISLEWNNGLNNVFTRDNRLPTTNESIGTQLNGPRIESVINYLALNLGIYF